MSFTRSLYSIRTTREELQNRSSSPLGSSSVVDVLVLTRLQDPNLRLGGYSSTSASAASMASYASFS